MLAGLRAAKSAAAACFVEVAAKFVAAEEDCESVEVVETAGKLAEIL